MASMLRASTGSDMVKLETMAGVKSISLTESRTGFPVLVRVTAPLRRAQRPGLDVVAVLDISGSMRGERLESMKQATLFVIDNLSPDDRLAIVPFKHRVFVPMRLSTMSDENREKARTLVRQLTATGSGNMAFPLHQAAQVLKERASQESSSRIGRIIFLSDGEDYVEAVQHISSEFPVDTFGLGESHNPEVMHYIADKTYGVYSYVNKDLEKIKDAFAQSIGGLTTVTAMDILIKLQTQDGVCISSIESGIYQQIINSDKQTATIQINDLYAGEKKNFIVFLIIPEGKKDLITVNGSYKSPDLVQLQDSKVVIRRPNTSIPSGEADVLHEVAQELARLELVKGISNMAKVKGLDKNKLQSLWDGIRNSTNGRKIPELTLSDLDNDVDAIKRDGKAFMLSWLTSHLSQRATTKGSPSESGAFQTTAMKNMLRIADNKEAEPEPEPEPEMEPEPEPEPEPKPELKDKSKTRWQKVITRAKSNPCSCALPSVTLLLLAASLLIMYNRTLTIETTTIIIEQKNNISSPLDVSKHPGWPKMEKALEVTMLRSMEDVGIASLFNGASVEDMRHATNRYLYLAIVHASVLGSRCKSEDVTSISQLEEKVSSLESEKKDLLVQSEALVKAKEEIEVSAANCAAGKENDEALMRANTRIAELEKQVQDKKAFADSLHAEVTNADEHLKTCGQRVDMLEAKVREMEGVVIN